MSTISKSDLSDRLLDEGFSSEDLVEQIPGIGVKAKKFLNEKNIIYACSLYELYLDCELCEEPKQEFKKKMTLLIEKNWTRVAFNRTYAFMREYKLRRLAEDAANRLSVQLAHTKLKNCTYLFICFLLIIFEIFDIFVIRF